MYCVTIQNKEVYNTLIKTGTYTASMSNVSDILRKPYKFLMKELGYKSCPIFLASVGHYAEFGGAKFNKESIAIELNIPDELLSIQRYYCWSDLVYFMESPWEFEEASNVEQFNSVEEWGKTILNIKEQLVKADNFKDPIQITVPILRKEWLTDVTENTSKIEETHDGYGGRYKLERLSHYK